MDVITYAILKKRIGSALTGIANIYVDNVTNQIVFVTNDGTEFKLSIPANDVVYVGPTAPDPDKYKMWIDTSDPGTPSRGDAVLTQDLTATTAIGSVYKGKTYAKGTSLETIVRDILISYEKPTMTLGINPTTTLYDAEEDTLSALTISANVTKKTEDIDYVKYYVDGTLANTLTTGVANGGLFKYDHTFTTPIGRTFVVKIETRDVTAKSVVTAQTTVTFVPKSYYGVIEDGTPINEASVKALSHELKKSVAGTYTYTATYGRFVYAVPASIGSVSTAKDLVNNFNYTDSITKTTLTINGINYNLVYLTDPMGFEGVKITYA